VIVMKNILEKFSLIGGVFFKNESGLIFLSSNELNRDQIMYTAVVKYENEKLIPLGSVNYDVIDWCITNEEDLRCHVITNKNKLFEIDPSGIKEQDLNGTNLDKRDSDLLRIVYSIDGMLYLGGMDGFLMKRNIKGRSWNNVCSNQKIVSNLGFEGMCGFGLNEIYVVGWDGSVALFSEQYYELLDFPVNTILTDVVCLKNNYIYVCGRNGTLIKGSKNNVWEILDNENVQEDFWSIVEFNSRIFVSSSSAIYEIKDDKLIAVILDIEGIKNLSFFYLFSSNSLWSIGEKDLLNYDGCKWRKIL